MIYYINVFLEIVFGIFILYGINEESDFFQQKVMSYNRKKVYCIFAGILWILISGLRGLEIGADTYAYFTSYNAIKNESLFKLWNNIYQRYILHQDIQDPGYDFFVKLTQYVTDNYQIFLIIVAVVFMVPFTIWIAKESKNPIISFVLYSSLFFAFFSITGIRQTIATALVVLVGDWLIKEKKIVFFIIVCLIASTIHYSALVFLPFYFMSKIPVNRKTIFGWSIIFILAIIFRYQLKMIFIDMSGYTDYAETYAGAGTPTFTILLFLLFILSILSYKRDQDLKEYNRFYVALYMAIFFLPLTWLNPSAMRIVQYFSIYLVVLVPEMIESVFDNRSKKNVTVIVIIVLVALLIKNQPSYCFFWQ